MFARILVPFDGSTNAEDAVHKAVELAGLTGAELVLLTVYRHHSMLESSFSMVGHTEPGNMDAILRKHAQEVAEHGKAIAREAGAEKVRAFIKSGPPARTIVAWAKEKDVDLIILGSRGLGSVEGYLLGSVSHKVTGLARCPVMVV
ncbi:MAG TPA: universal stress protein [Paracoccus sp.]|nr:universal stress protein [Paracoccus sp. (in: a-proteobacteria)]